MAIEVVMRVVGFETSPTTITIQTSVTVPSQGTFGHDFTGVLANIPNAAAMTPFLKGQTVTFVKNQFGLTVLDTEISVFGGPQ